MKRGFSTGNKRCSLGGLNLVKASDNYLNFAWEKNGEPMIAQFYNVTDPKRAVEILRNMANAIERESK